VSRRASTHDSKAVDLSPPGFSIVMAAHDNARTIGEAIESVRRQTRSDWELIVVDDCSSDGTADVAEGLADPRIRVARQPENRGPGAARNRGISLARAPVVCPLDSDDLWLPQYLETMARALDSNPTAAVACADAWVLDEGTGRVRRTSAVAMQHPPDPLPDDPRTFLAELLRRNFVYYSVAARRESLLAVGGYDERLWVGEDWELWLRLAAAGFRFVSVPRLLGVHRKRAGSLTSSSDRLVAGRYEVYRVVGEEWDATPEVRDLALSLRRARELRGRRRAAVAALFAPLAALRRRLRDSMLWHHEPPRDVQDLLLAIATTRQA
jgi:glycosyltransferase involved in cell wall biosynthesis